MLRFARGREEVMRDTEAGNGEAILTNTGVSEFAIGQLPFQFFTPATC